VGALLAPHPQGPQPSALGDFSVPTAEEGRAIPVVFGTCMIKGGNTVWWGDLKSKAIKVGGGILSFGRTQTIGFKYYLGLQFMLCHGPVDALVEIQADGKTVPGTQSVVDNGNGSENYIDFEATGDKLFGGTGPGGGGGMSGTIRFYRGLQTQQPDDYLGAKQGRVTTDQSGIGYTFHGVGNGGITSLSAGSSSLEETFTITFNSIDGNVSHSTFGKAKWDIVGSVSGALSNSVANAEGSHALWSDQAFSNSRINVTIHTGSTQYASGDFFTIKTLHSQVAPTYRGLCYAVFKQLYVGTSNYLKPPAFIVRRCPNPLGASSGFNISGDANPVYCIYEILTNVDYGLGIDPSRIDATSFSTAAATLASEALGISMMFDQQASADQLIGEILRHCDGVLYTDPQTGLWTVKLARADYDPTTIPVLTVDSVLGTPDFSRGSWRETTNLVNIRYSSRAANFDDRSIRAYDPANVAVTGEVRPQNIDFKGLSNATSAALVATRVLKTLTYPLAKMKIVANRNAWQFRPGGVFRFTWVPLGVVNQVFRITRISYGELLSGKISMDVVEDIFGINSVAFVSPPSSGWTNPVGAPLANSHEHVEEAPLHLLMVEGLTPGTFGVAVASHALATAANDYQVWRDDGAGFADTGFRSAFCPVGVLAADYGPAGDALDTTGFTLTSASIDLALLESSTDAEREAGKNLLMLVGPNGWYEICAWENITANSDGSYTVSKILRGVFDTTPLKHSAGALVFFFSDGSSLTNNVPVADNSTINARFLPENSLGVLPISSAATNSCTTRSRYKRPYPPGNLRMQGQAYGVRYTTIVGDLVLAWSERNSNVAGLTPLTHQDHTDITAPGTVGWAVDVSIGGVSAGAEVSAPTKTVTITAAARAAMSVGAGDDPLDVDVFALDSVSTLYSFMPQRATVIFTGFGMTFGEYFGGIQQ